MKKALILLILIFALIFTSCDFNIDGFYNPDVPGGGSGAEHIGDTCKHTDRDGNKKCDGCDKNTQATLDFLAVNDLHGKIFDSDTHIGVDELTTFIKNTREANQNFVLISSGDMWQGSYESNLTKGLMMTDWMNAAGFHSMTIGNHEYDWGSEYIRENAKAADFPILGINVYDTDTDEIVDYCQPSAVVECEGFEVGIIGAVGDCYSSISPEKCNDVYFIVGDKLTKLIKDEATRLRKRGVDIIVLSIHDGRSSGSSGISSVSSLPYYDSELSNGYVDAVFEAHTHQSYILKDSYGVYHLQGGGDNTGISKLTATYDIVSGNFTVSTAANVKSSSYSSLPDDPIVESLREKYKQTVALGELPVADLPTYMSSNTIEDLAAYVYLKAGIEKWGNSYDIFLGGGFIKARAPYDLEAGEVYYKDIYGILPFDNDLVLASIRGSDLLSRFVNTTNSDYHLSYSAYGSTNMNSINKSAIYYVVTDTYSLYYAPNRLTAVDFYDVGVYARDLLADYLKAQYPPKSLEPDNPSGGGGAPESDYMDKLITVGEALAIGSQQLAVGERTTEYYYVTGTVKSIANTEYGNMYISDDNGNEIYIYGLYGESGGKFNTLEKTPAVGDTVIVKSQILYYEHNSDSSKNKLELEHAYLMHFSSKSAATAINQSEEIASSVPLNNRLFAIALSIKEKANYGKIYYA